MTALRKYAVALSMIAMSAPAWAITPVPEPGTAWLLGMGLAGIVATKLIRRK